MPQIYREMASGKWRSGTSKQLTTKKALNCILKRRTGRKSWTFTSLPHLMTIVSPAELPFGWKIHTKLSELIDVHVEQGVCDRDSKRKSKSKTYADTEGGARYWEVLPGDELPVQQERKDKFLTRFDPSPYTVVHIHAWEQLDCAAPRRSPVLLKHFTC